MGEQTEGLYNSSSVRHLAGRFIRVENIDNNGVSVSNTYLIGGQIYSRG